MAFIQYPNPTPVFPVLSPLSWSVHKKPIMASRIITAISGRETQVACAAYPRWSFVLSYGGNSWLRDQTQNSVAGPNAIGKTELQQISGLFLQCLGDYGEFYFDDPDDDSRSAQSVGIGNGVTTTFPLYYTWGNGPFIPAFTAPVGGINTIDTVYFNGTPQSAALYSLDSTKTQLVFVSAPASNTVITVDFHFYFRCRFLDEKQDYEQWEQNLWQIREVRFESVKP